MRTLWGHGGRSKIRRNNIKLTGPVNFQQRPIWAIENAQDWKISDESQFGAIVNSHKCMVLTDNFRQRTIEMNKKNMGAHGNAREHTGVQEKDESFLKRAITNAQ